MKCHPGRQIGRCPGACRLGDFGEVNVSASARVLFELIYRGRAPDRLPKRVLAKMIKGDGRSAGFIDISGTKYQRLRPELVIETLVSIDARYDHDSSGIWRHQPTRLRVHVACVVVRVNRWVWIGPDHDGLFCEPVSHVRIMTPRRRLRI
jgi:hypothetical protein